MKDGGAKSLNYNNSSYPSGTAWSPEKLIKYNVQTRRIAMARSNDSRSRSRSARMRKIGNAARDTMTLPNMLAAGAVALGAAAFAMLRDEQRRTRIKDAARRWREELPARMPQMKRTETVRKPQAVPALP